jgi:hypothetical protein
MARALPRRTGKGGVEIMPAAVKKDDKHKSQAASLFGLISIRSILASQSGSGGRYMRSIYL